MRGGHKGIKTEPRTYAGARTHMVENCTNENLVDHCLLTRPFKTPYMYIYMYIYIYIMDFSIVLRTTVWLRRLW
jgi:hypothetical protein